MGLFSKKDKAKPGFFKKLFSSSDNAAPEDVISQPKPVAMPPPAATELPPPTAAAPRPPPAPLAEPTDAEEDGFVVKPLPKVTSPRGTAKPTMSGTSSASRGRRGRAAAAREEPEVVSIVVETRTKLDTSRLRNALSNLQGVVRGADGLVVACTYDEALLGSSAALVEETGRLQHTSYVALAHRANVVALADFFVDTVNMLDANAAQLNVDHARLLRRLRGVVREGREASETLAHPGWLMRMARGEGVAGEFAHLQATALSLLRAEGLDACTLASFDGRNRRLAESHFPDMGFAVRKALKTLGGGALEAGVVRLRQNAGEQAILARQLEVPEDAVAAEAALDPFFSADSMKIVEEGPARDADALKVFKEYCTTSNDAVTADGFESLMTHMGLLERRPEEDRPAAARAALVTADSDYDGALDYTEFRAFYGRYPVTSVRLHLRMTASLETEHRVREVFNAFATFGASKPATPRAGGVTTPRGASGSFTPRAGGGVTSPRAAGTPTKAAAGGEGLDCARFAKLCRDCGLVSWGMTASHLDTIFHATKPRAARRLDFDHFLAALVLVADRRGQSLAQVARAIAEAGGPALRGTRSTFVSLHDDPSKTRGSITERPDTGPGTLDLRLLVDRSKDATPKALPRPRGAVPSKPEPTRPESPKLSTRWRVANSGPCTPGRGANMEAVEALAASKAAVMASPRGPRVSFGRTMTHKATPKRDAPAPASPAKTATPAAKKEAPVKSSSTSFTANRQLFAEPEPLKSEPVFVPAAVEDKVEEPTPAVFAVPDSPVAAFEAEVEAETELEAPVAPAAPAFADPFASMSSGITMVSLGSMQTMRSMAEVTPVKEEKPVEAQEEEEPTMAPTPFFTPAPAPVVEVNEEFGEEPASLVRSASYAAMMAALYGTADTTSASVEVKEFDLTGAPSFGSPLELPSAAIAEAVAAVEAAGEPQEEEILTPKASVEVELDDVSVAAEAIASEVSMSQSESDAECKPLEVQAL